jgi:hypothetical protein
MSNAHVHPWMVWLILLIGNLPAFGGQASKSVRRTKSPDPIRVVRTLDQNGIHNIYREGDFEVVVALIDSFTNYNETYSKDDSVFIAKHLAVIYSANPSTRELGKNYMFRLLDLLPSAKIVDMFVSDEIDHIFEKVREEYVVRLRAMGKEPPSHMESNQYAANKLTMQENPNPANPVAAGKPKKSGTSSTGYWVAGGVTLVAVAGTAFYFLQPKKSTDKTYDLPE